MPKYYKVAEDIEKYNNAWLYMVVGGRSTGKTYNALCDCLDQNRRFLFVKRTIKDVSLLCSKNSDRLSPFKPINRDRCINIETKLLCEGFGGFFDGDELIGYVGALTGIGKFTGFDLSDCDWIIFDEFIPRKWDRVFQSEGDQLLDLYMTVNRDRQIRGFRPTTLICLANSTSISCPTNNALMVTDIFGDMIASGEDIHYDEDKGIFIHMLEHNDISEALKQSQFYKAVEGTPFASMAFDNEFSRDDTSAVGAVSLKGYRCKACVIYQLRKYYIYRKGRNYFVSLSPAPTNNIYNLDHEIDQRSFQIDYQINLKYATIEGNCIYEKFSVYDMIMNFNKYFKV